MKLVCMVVSPFVLATCLAGCAKAPPSQPPLHGRIFWLTAAQRAAMNPLTRAAAGNQT